MPHRSRGILYAVLAIIIVSARDIVYSETLKTIPMGFMVFCSFTITILFFLAWEFKRGTRLTKLISANRNDILSLNVTTAIMWLAYLSSLKLIPPAVTSTVDGGVGPVAALLFSYFLIGRRSILASEVVFSVATLASVVYVALSLHGKATAGILIAVLSGSATALTAVTSKRLAMAGLTASQLMTVRFPLLIVASGMLWAFGSNPVMLTGNMAMHILISTVAGIILPLLLIQMALVATSPVAVMLALALHPVLTLLFQNRFTNHAMNAASQGALIASVVFAILGIWVPQRWKV